MLKTFSEQFETFRLHRQLSKTFIAKKVGVSLTYIMNLCKGNAKPPTNETLHKITRLLDLNEKETCLLFVAAFKERLSADDKSYINDIKRLSKQTGLSLDKLF